MVIRYSLFALISVLLVSSSTQLLFQQQQSQLEIIKTSGVLHVVTRIGGSISVYSGNNISNREGLKKAYKGNHYWNLENITFLKMLLGMTIQKVPLDDLDTEIKDLTVKCKGEKKWVYPGKKCR